MEHVWQPHEGFSHLARVYAPLGLGLHYVLGNLPRLLPEGRRITALLHHLGDLGAYLVPPPPQVVHLARQLSPPGVVFYELVQKGQLLRVPPPLQVLSDGIGLLPDELDVQHPSSLNHIPCASSPFRNY